MANGIPPAPNFTDEVSSLCGKKAVFAVDVMDTARRLFVEHVSLDETLSQCGCDQGKCDLLEEWINKERKAAGKEKLTDEEKIWPGTTIRQVISYVC